MVSVVISCFNSVAYLDLAIESVLTQTFADLELVLVDDGSSDDTWAIIRRYAGQDRRITPIQKMNTGVADSLNVGIREAKGKWIARLDADDIAIPNRLELQLSYLSHNKDLVLVGGGCIEIDSLGRQIKEFTYPEIHGKLLRRLVKGLAFFPHSSSMYRKSDVLRLGGYNPRFTRSQDSDLWLRIGENGTIACLPKPIIMLRKHSESISHHDQGKTQRLMGTAARICHLLRLRELPDPSQGELDVWGGFMDWLAKRLQEEGFLESNEAWMTLRQEWYGAESHRLLNRGIALSKQLVESPVLLRIALHNLFGSNAAIRLTDEWVNLKSLSGQIG